MYVKDARNYLSNTLIIRSQKFSYRHVMVTHNQLIIAYVKEILIIMY